MSKNIALIMAAGKGKRMGTNVNKQFIEIKGKPILYYTLQAFSSCDDIDGIVIVAAKDEVIKCQEEIVDKYHFCKVISIVCGGEERHNSVFNGLIAVKEKVVDCDVVLIHDGARPFIKQEIIANGIKYAKKYGAAACGVTPKDTIKLRNESGFSENTFERDMLFCVQTPQIFDFNLIYNCHEKINELKTKVTDDTMVVEQFGNKVYLYPGSYDNVKITTAEDVAVGEYILSRELY